MARAVTKAIWMSSQQAILNLVAFSFFANETDVWERLGFSVCDFDCPPTTADVSPSSFKRDVIQRVCVWGEACRVVYELEMQTNLRSSRSSSFISIRWLSQLRFVALCLCSSLIVKWYNTQAFELINTFQSFVQQVNVVVFMMCHLGNWFTHSDIMMVDGCGWCVTSTYIMPTTSIYLLWLETSEKERDR